MASVRFINVQARPTEFREKRISAGMVRGVDSYTPQCRYRYRQSRVTLRRVISREITWSPRAWGRPVEIPRVAGKMMFMPCSG